MYLHLHQQALAALFSLLPQTLDFLSRRSSLAKLPTTDCHEPEDLISCAEKDLPLVPVLSCVVPLETDYRHQIGSRKIPVSSPCTLAIRSEDSKIWLCGTVTYSIVQSAPAARCFRHTEVGGYPAQRILKEACSSTSHKSIARHKKDVLLIICPIPNRFRGRGTRTLVTVNLSRPPPTQSHPIWSPKIPRT